MRDTAELRQIPDFLSHLRTDRRGLPVPYVNRWGLEEDLTRVYLDHDRNVGRPGVFYRDDDLDVPNFTAQNMGRQRECMMQGLCQVCGKFIPWNRRFLVVAALSVERIKLGLRRVPVVTEPWLDEQCCEFAVKMCPALIRRSREEQLTVLPITSKRDVQAITSTGWIDGPYEEESRRVQPAMWVKLALTGTRIKIR
jgi:hypothetical protein